MPKRWRGCCRGDITATDDLDALLARGDVEAVDIALTIATQPDAVRRALAAGKHVISEKPVAATVAEGRALLGDTAGYTNLVWMIAENWRYEPSLIAAQQIVVSGGIGRVISADFPFYVAMNPDNKYYHTAWRREGSYQGGFILDAGVHHTAALRMLLGEASQVRALATLHNPNLPPLDSLSGAIRFESGVIASYHVTFAVGVPFATAITVAGEGGTLRVSTDQLTIYRDGGEMIHSFERDGVFGELRAFADAIRHGTAHMNAPIEGLRDVALIEALLNAAETGTPVTPERL